MEADRLATMGRDFHHSAVIDLAGYLAARQAKYVGLVRNVLTRVARIKKRINALHEEMDEEQHDGQKCKNKDKIIVNMDFRYSEGPYEQLTIATSSLQVTVED